MKRFRGRKAVVLAAPNAFKGGLSAVQAAAALARGIRSGGGAARPLPLADGGDGTLEVLARALGLKRRPRPVTGPEGRRLSARWAAGPSTALVEMAQASGLAGLRGKPNPFRTTSFGTGQLLRAAGRRRVYLAVGGSATVDGGLGLLQALGGRVAVRRGRGVEWLSRPATGKDLAAVADISPPPTAPLVTVLADVRNPLLGPRGAARFFGPQKGATPAQVKALEKGLVRLAALIHKKTGRRVGSFPCGGAAGGVPALLRGLFNARVLPGAPWIFRSLGVAKAVRAADAVFTGEGRFDAGSFEGKATGSLVDLARRLGKPVYVFTGQTPLGPKARRGARVVILGGPRSRTAALLERRAAEAVQSLKGSVHARRRHP